jgi:hypothetical protein
MNFGSPPTPPSSSVARSFDEQDEGMRGYVAMQMLFLKPLTMTVLCNACLTGLLHLASRFRIWLMSFKEVILQVIEDCAEIGKCNVNIWTCDYD